MQIRINQTPHLLPDHACLAQALESAGFKPPFAVAVNLHFIPKNQYAVTVLKEGDEVEVISPITGG